MKTEIKITQPNVIEDKDIVLSFSDDDFSIDGWLTMQIDGNTIGEVFLPDLMPALIGFDAKYSRNKSQN